MSADKVKQYTTTVYKYILASCRRHKTNQHFLDDIKVIGKYDKLKSIFQKRDGLNSTRGWRQKMEIKSRTGFFK